MKKKYIKPSCRNYQLSSVHQLLSGSYKDSQTEKESDDWLNYVPSIDSEIMNNKARMTLFCL